MRIALAVCIALTPLTSVADSRVYRCEKSGNVSFSDQPCANGAKSSQRTISDPAANSVYDFQVKVIHYPVEGRDYKSLMRSLRERGPLGYHGLASWRIVHTYTTKQIGKYCEISAVRLTVTGEILMPSWTDEPTVPIELQRRWQAQYARLKQHEDGHIQHGKEMALLVNAGLVGLGAVPCERLEALAEAEYKRIYSNLVERDHEYDARTQHGRFAE